MHQSKVYWFDKLYNLRDRLSRVTEYTDTLMLTFSDAKLLHQILIAAEGELYPLRSEISAQLAPLLREPTTEPPAARGRQTMSAREVSEYLGVSYDMVLSLVRQGKMPCVEIGNRKIFKRDTIDDWLKEQSVLRKEYGGKK